MIKLMGRVGIPALLLGAVMGMFTSPVAASTTMDYPPGTYELYVDSQYTPQSNQENASCGGSPVKCPYVPADFAHGAKYSGGPTTYDFTMSPSVAAYFNIAGPVDPIDYFEELSVTIFTCSGMGTTCNSPTQVAGPLNLLNVPEPNGYSIALAAGLNYEIAVTLVTDDDPTNYESLTSTAQGQIVPTATPLPSTLPLFSGGLGMLGLLGWRRKRKTTPRAI